MWNCKRKLQRAAVTLCVLLTVLTAAYELQPHAVVPASGKVVPGSVPLPVLMYHSMLPPAVMHGRYIVSPELFEQDLHYLQQQGYTTVNIQDLLNYVNGKSNLPAKPIMLSFDDGYYNNYKYAYPLLKKYHMKMVLSPIGICTEQFSKADSDHERYSHVTWAELNEMLNSGLVEVQNHTYNLHHSGGGRLGASKRRSESVSAYQTMLHDDLNHMQNLMCQNTGVHMTAFVYPFGAISEASGLVIRNMGFQATLTCTEKMNYLTHDPQCLYGLNRYLRPPQQSSEQFFARKILPALKAAGG